jgi:protein TonB
MKPNTSRTLDDMVFENRNKEYGSYRIRKKYHLRLGISFIFSLSFLVLLVLSYFWYLNSAGNAAAYLDHSASPFLKSTEGSLLSKEELDAYLNHPASPDEQVIDQNNMQQTDQSRNFRVTENANPDTFKPLLDDQNISEDIVSGTESTEDSMVFGEGSGNGLDKLPEFPGGIAGVTRYLELNVFYPPQAIRQKIHGVVLVSFEVNRLGLVDNIRIERSINPMIDAEAIKAIMAMPRWKPGMRHGRPIPVKFVVPVNFMPMS